MTELDTAPNASFRDQVVGQILSSGRRHSTAYLVVEGLSTALAAVAIVRSNLNGYDMRYPAHARPLNGGYGVTYRVTSVLAIGGIAGTAAQLVDRMRDGGGGVYGPIADKTPNLVGSAISNTVIAIRSIKMASRGHGRKYPLTAMGRIGFLVTGVKAAIGAYESVRELLSRPEVQRQLGVAAGYTMSTAMKLRAKLPFGNKAVLSQSTEAVEVAKQSIEASLASDSLSDAERAQLEMLLNLANNDPELFTLLVVEASSKE